MNRKFSFMFLNKNFRVLKKLMCFIGIAVPILLFIPSCDENNGGGTGSLAIHGFLLCDHRNEALQDLMDVMDIAEHNGRDANHIILDGINLEQCTQEEIGLMQEAFNLGFIILAYDMNEDRIRLLVDDLLGHPFLIDLGELETIGEDYGVFTIENIGGVLWTSLTHFGGEVSTNPLDTSEFVTNSQSVTSQTRQVGSSGGFINHGNRMVEWIEDQIERIEELIESGLIEGNATQVLNNFGMMDEIEKELEAVTRTTATQSGSLVSLASAWIQTNQFKVSIENSSIITSGFDSNAPFINTYQMVTKAWIATATTPTGVFSFLCVNQDFTMASTNGFHVDTDTQQNWYLGEFKNVNTLSVNGTKLTFASAELLDNEPDTNQATTSSETTSVSTSISGTVGVDQTSGANGSVSGGISWSTSNTFSKANVSINNQSLSQTTFGNDASWQFLPRKAEILDDGCANSIHNLADLAHQTFTFSQAFIYRINGSFTNQTVTLNTAVSTTMTNTYIDNCNVFGCGCDAVNQNESIGSATKTFTQNIHIPSLP